MSNNEYFIKNYDKSIVKITTQDKLDDGTGFIVTDVGTGFIVTDDGIICTCYHVVGNLDTKKLYDTIQIYFHNKNQPINATVLLKVDDNEPYVDPENDIAFLQISKEDQDKLKKGGQELIPLPLSESIVFGHEFRADGFRKADEFKLGLGTEGKIIKLTKYNIDIDTTIPIIQLYATDIEGGMSGSPAFDLDTNKVIGMIDRIYDKEDRNDPNLVMAIPVESLVKVYQDLSNKNSGLILINQFLEHIGSAKNIKYKNFDDVYVPPKEYPDIQKALEEKRCVFITGTPEYGKTFTAVKLMWDKWKESNKTITCHFPKKLDDKNEILQNIKDGNDNEKYSNSIIYLDDPTGKTESDYQLNTIFRDSIVSVIETLPSINSYLIVTMRENIYQRTKTDMGAGVEKKLEQGKYIRRLEIGSPSYDYKSRKEILLRWGDQMKCAWLDNDRFLTIILDELKNEKLPTPYNIYSFTVSTGLDHDNYTIQNEDHLKEIIHKYSQKISEIFATNIRDISKDEYYKILYVCFPFISDEFPKAYVERKFRQIMDEKYPNDKDYNKYKFLEASEYHNGTVIFSPEVQFVHPSLSEALPYLLMRNNLPDQYIQNIFAKVLMYLAYDPLYCRIISHFILKNYELIVPEDVKNILKKFLDCTDFKGKVIDDIFAYFDKIDDSVRTKAIELVKTNDEVDSDIARSIRFYLDKLPPSAIDKLLELAKTDEDIIKSLLPLVFLYFDKVDDSVRTKAIELVKTNDEVDSDIARSIWFYRSKLPPSAIDKLLELAKTNDKVASGIATFVSGSLDELPPSAIDKLLELAKTNDKVASGIVEFLLDMQPSEPGEDKLPPSALDKLPPSAIDKLLELAKTNDKVASGIAEFVSYKIDKLSPYTIDKLLELAKTDEDIIKSLLPLVFLYFDKVDDSVRTKAIELVKTNDKVDSDIAKFVRNNFDKLPPSAIDKLLELAKTNEQIADSIAKFVSYDIDKLPPSAIDKLLELAKTDEDTIKSLLPLVFLYFDKIDDSVRTKAIELVKTNDEVASDIARSIWFYLDKLPPSAIDKLLELAKTDEDIIKSLLPLVFLYFDKVDDSVRTKAIELVKTNDKVDSDIAKFVRNNFDKLPPSAIDKLLELAKTNEQIADSIAKFVSYDIDKLPPSAISIILEQTKTDNENVFRSIIPLVFANFDKVDESVRTKAIELAKTDGRVADDVANLVSYKIDKLPPSAIDKLLELAKTNDKVASGIVDFLLDRQPPPPGEDKLPPSALDKLPPSAIDKLLELAKTNDKVASGIARSVRYNFDKLPPSAISIILEQAKTNEQIAESIGDIVEPILLSRPELIPLATKILETLFPYIDTNKYIASKCVRIIYIFFEKLDPILIKKLLLKLVDSISDDVFNYITSFIIGNYKFIDNKTLDILLQNERIINFLKRNSSLVDDMLMKKLN